ncbi:MAG TPA: hypothetical protein VHP36_05880 [Chitinispirillaceae bacterium]|nr:hypothetical protein [Chitinispirillaceae bacterium]
MHLLVFETIDLVLRDMSKRIFVYQNSEVKMANPLEDRLSQLRNQYDSGRKDLEKLQQQQNDLQVTLLRISGAVQVLEEEIMKAKNQQQSQG